MQIFWEKFWHQDHWFVRKGRDWYNRFFMKVLLEQVTDRSDFLEIGCGHSSLHPALSGHVQSITGVDYVQGAVTASQMRAQQHGYADHSTYICADGFQLPFPEGSFDIVWSQGLLEHYRDADLMLKEQMRVCRAGGKVIISVPSRPSYLSLWYAITYRIGLKALWPWTEQIFFTPRQMRELCRRAGLSPKMTKSYRLRPALIGILICVVEKR